ncbi:MAG: histidine kinase [Halopenitus sp.]
MTTHSDVDVDEPARFQRPPAWKGGATAGLVATVAMGLVIMAMDAEALRGAIAGLYGLSGNVLAGGVAHLAHGTLFGVLFAVVLADPGLYRLTDWRWKTVLAGVIYGLLLAVVGAGIIMPIWLNAAGFPASPTMPFVTNATLLWHLVYGLVLGSLFPVVEHL